jgi:hypothetical protein
MKSGDDGTRCFQLCHKQGQNWPWDCRIGMQTLVSTFFGNWRTSMLRTALLGLTMTLSLASAAQADRYNRVVTIINGTSANMREFYVASRDAKYWSKDILGQDVLYAGYQLDVNVDDGTGYCVYDVKAVFVDGSEVTDRLNVCETGTWRVHD